MFLPKTLLLYLLVYLTSCVNERKESKSFAQDVLCEIFPDLVDSIWVNVYFQNQPKKVEVELDSTQNKFIEKPSKQIQTKAEAEKDLKNIHGGFDSVLIIIEDSLRSTNTVSEHEILSHFREIENFQVEDSPYSRNKIHLSECKPKNGFRIQLASAYSDSIDDYRTLNKIILFSISFDRNKKFGVLTFDYSRGFNMSQGYTVFIIRQGGRWLIDAVKFTWIS